MLAVKQALSRCMILKLAGLVLPRTAKIRTGTDARGLVFATDVKTEFKHSCGKFAHRCAVSVSFL
ncbi:hypothetical protein TPHV1_80110 [Treponema phagedenis]|uniref:Uncharacterized protein n=1 Tax=Treponema phagedenis TaxID=162 RepID=A0A0B7H0E2_TREPH|nr:hypothetical protein TPHV1_80110 [Treponema phagedenis]